MKKNIVLYDPPALSVVGHQRPDHAPLRVLLAYVGIRLLYKRLASYPCASAARAPDGTGTGNPSPALSLLKLSLKPAVKPVYALTELRYAGVKLGKSLGKSSEITLLGYPSNLRLASHRALCLPAAQLLELLLDLRRVQYRLQAKLVF